MHFLICYRKYTFLYLFIIIIFILIASVMQLLLLLPRLLLMFQSEFYKILLEN